MFYAVAEQKLLIQAFESADGKAIGGTGQAIRIANSLDIPVYNLYNNNEVNELANKIASL